MPETVDRSIGLIGNMMGKALARVIDAANRAERDYGSPGRLLRVEVKLVFEFESFTEVDGEFAGWERPGTVIEEG